MHGVSSIVYLRAFDPLRYGRVNHSRLWGRDRAIWMVRSRGNHDFCSPPLLSARIWALDATVAHFVDPGGEILRISEYAGEKH